MDLLVLSIVSTEYGAGAGARPVTYCTTARYREARAEVPDSFGLVANKIWKDRLVVVSPSLATP